MLRLIATAVMLLGLSTAQAAEPDWLAQHYSDQLSSRSDARVRNAARELYDSGYQNLAVLDLAAEVLWRGYAVRNADSMAWLCKVLGASGQGRYRNVVRHAAASGRYKLERHCDEAITQLAGAPGEPYVPGSAQRVTDSDSSRTAPSIRGVGPFSRIELGMTPEEVEQLIGLPTTLTLRPRRRSGGFFETSGDLEQYALYQGKGTVRYSRSRYRPLFRVTEIINDPAESGHPDR